MDIYITKSQLLSKASKRSVLVVYKLIFTHPQKNATFLIAESLMPREYDKSKWLRCLALEQNFSIPRSVRWTHSDRATYFRILPSPRDEMPESVMLHPDRLIPDSLEREHISSTPASVRNSQ